VPPASELRHVSQNLVVAHRDGGIGWQVTGMLPLRGRGSGSFRRRVGRQATAGAAICPLRGNPGVTNPDSHQLVNANNRSVPEDSPVNLANSWLPPYRAQRIEELLDSRTRE
jgi:penicillin amidase